MKDRWKKWTAAALAALLLGTAAGCAPQEEPAPQGEALRIENDGSDTTLVLAQRFVSDERTAALEEIAQKYTADFPGTQIQIVTVESGEEALSLLREGEADLVELSQEEQPQAVEEGLLLELSDYWAVWEERARFTTSARQAVYSMGGDFIYLLPATLNQDIVYYRADWFEAFNEGKEEGLVYARVWEDFPDAQEKLADTNAAGLVFGGKEGLVDLFDAILWSAVDTGRMEDTAAAYFSAVDDNPTVFSLEQAERALEQLSMLLEGAVPAESLDWTEDEAIGAFVNGEAIALLAGQDRMGEIAAAMEDGTWATAAYPRGNTGKAVAPLEFTGFGVAAATGSQGNAVHFLTYLENQDNNTHLAKACGTVPIHTTAADLEPTLEDTGLAVNLLMVRRADWYFYGQEPVMYTAQEGWRQLADAQLRRFTGGELSGGEMLEGFAAYWEEARQAEGELWSAQEE